MIRNSRGRFDRRGMNMEYIYALRRTFQFASENPSRLMPLINIRVKPPLCLHFCPVILVNRISRVYCRQDSRRNRGRGLKLQLDFTRNELLGVDGRGSRV